MVERVKNLLALLETPGGNLLILLICVVLSGFAVLTIHYSDQVDTVMLATFSAFSGALLNALSGNIMTLPAKPKDPVPPVKI